MARRRTTTAKVRAAARRNIFKAQTVRFRLKEPRSPGRRARQLRRGSR